VASLCLCYRCSVTSWIRTTKRNREKGGVPHSLHLLGYAVDVVPDNWAVATDVMRRARRLGLRAILEPDHIHLQLD